MKYKFESRSFFQDVLAIDSQVYFGVKIFLNCADALRVGRRHRLDESASVLMNLQQCAELANIISDGLTDGSNAYRIPVQALLASLDEF